MDKSLTARNIYSKLLELIRQNKSCVLCTVTGTQGSTPQKPGSSALFDEDGLLLGTVGGGVVELTIQKQAQEAIHSKKSNHYLFELVNDIGDEKLTECGGKMSILLDAAPEEHFSLFSEIEEAIQNNIPVILLTFIKKQDNGDNFIQRMCITAKDLESGSYGLKGVISETVKKMLANPVRGDFKEFMVKKTKTTNHQIILLESVLPQLRLLIAGAGHVGKALSHLAKLLDFEVIVWDDRKEYANKNNLPDADKILTAKMDKIPRNFKVDRNTFIVILSASHKSDSDILKTFIGSDAGYIGMIGSEKKISQIKRKSFDEGWASKEQWDQIYAPIGIDILSKTIQEIAISIAAQLVQIRFQINHKNE